VLQHDVVKKLLNPLFLNFKVV